MRHGAVLAAAPGARSIPDGSALTSLWLAGFEGADHINRHGQAVDIVRITGHADVLNSDFARIAALGFGAARESIGWRLAEPHGGGRFDFSRALATARAAEHHGVQVLWTFMHYGVPPDVNLLDDAFIPRFVEFAAATARVLRPYGASAPVITPVNEISYLAWAVCESNAMHPHVGTKSDPR